MLKDFLLNTNEKTDSIHNKILHEQIDYDIVLQIANNF